MPKIPLDSSSDLAFLRLQLQQALSGRLQTHLPNALPEDAFRTLIESHISAFLSGTMQEAAQNVTINGLEPRPSDIAKGVQVEGESYETFDTALQAAVSRKHAELEASITRVTTMRRDVPRQIKEAGARRPAEEDSVDAPSIQEQDEGREEEEEMQGLAREVSIARADEVVGNYERSMKLVKEMKANVGGVSAKVQRAKEVLLHLQSQQS